MYKIKTFKGWSDDVEKYINQWFKEHPDIVIVSHQHTNNDSTQHISIIYTEKGDIKL